MDKKKWFYEVHRDILSIGFQFTKTLFDQKSNFQSVKVIETKGYGPMLINDDIVMTTQRDEFIYHEMIAHVPLMTHPNPEHVLIIGGGDGGTAREVLKHKKVKKCTMIEIDPVVVEACRKHLKVTSQSLDHPLLDLKFEDGAAYVAQHKNTFDVILVDSSDPVGPSAVLFGDAFYKNVYEALKEGGIVVAQGESPFYEMETQKRLLQTVHKFFKYVGFYNYDNLTYSSGLWSFLWASKQYHPIKDFKEERVDDAGIRFRYYNKEIHRASFCQPQFVKEALMSCWTL
ncbi:MAG: polyamine aminopropyltransferase [Bdellovibrionales bacterium]